MISIAVLVVLAVIGFIVGLSMWAVQKKVKSDSYMPAIVGTIVLFTICILVYNFGEPIFIFLEDVVGL